MNTQPTPDSPIDLLARLQAAPDDNTREWLALQFALDRLSPDLREAVWAAAIPHWFDTLLLTALLKTDLAAATNLYTNLCGLSIVEPYRDRGHNLHERARTLLLTRLWDEDSVCYRDLSARAAAHCAAQDQTDTLWRIETLYHQLSADMPAALEAFKKQMRAYRNANQLGAASNLLRSARELATLGCLSPEAIAEIEHQEYLMGWRHARLALEEAIPNQAQEHLAQALYFLDPKVDATHYYDLEHEQLRNSLLFLERQFLENNLMVAQDAGDGLRQQIWLRELADFYEYEVEDYTAALDRLNAVLELDPNDIIALARRGSIYRLMGDNQSALTEFIHIIELDSQNLHKYDNLENEYPQIEEWVQSPEPPDSLGQVLSLLRHTILQDPTHTFTESDPYTLACLEAIADNPDTTLDYLENALTHSPGSVPSLKLLALALLLGLSGKSSHSFARLAQLGRPGSRSHSPP